MRWFNKNKDVSEENKENYIECFDFEKYPVIEKEFEIKVRGATYENEDSGTDRQLVIEDTPIGTHLMLVQSRHKQATEPFKKANTIILQTNKPDSVNFIQFQRELMKFDYSIAKTNKILLTVSTELHELKTHPGWAYSYLYRVQFQDKKIIIKPFFRKVNVYQRRVGFPYAAKFHYLEQVPFLKCYFSEGSMAAGMERTGLLIPASMAILFKLVLSTAF